MKNANRGLKWLVCGLSLTTVLYNCKTKEVVTPAPVTYTFPGLDGVKLPDLKQTAPAAVSVTAATFTPSTQTDAVNGGLSDIASTGKVPAVVQQAGTDMGKAVSDDKARALVADFTADVIANLAKTGKLPASMQADVAAIAANPAVQAYMPTYTLPMVNGKPVGARSGANSHALVKPLNAVTDGSTDACKKAANDAFAGLVTSLDLTRQAQTATVNATYSAAEAAALADVTGCQNGVASKYTPLIAGATTYLNTTLARLTAARSVLGEQLYNLLVVLTYVAYSQTMNAFATLQAAESNTCTAVKDAKVAAAKAARDADLNTITTNYNTTLTAATAARDKAVANCHNQGNGG